MPESTFPQDTLDVCLDPTGLRVAYDEAGIAEVVGQLKAFKPALIVLEATGGLELRLASELAGHGMPLAVINPRQARDFAKATGQLAKTDAVDAAVLAAFAQAIRPQARPLKETFVRKLDELLTRRHQYWSICGSKSRSGWARPRRCRRKASQTTSPWTSASPI